MSRRLLCASAIIFHAAFRHADMLLLPMFAGEPRSPPRTSIPTLPRHIRSYVIFGTHVITITDTLHDNHAIHGYRMAGDEDTVTSHGHIGRSRQYAKGH